MGLKCEKITDLEEFRNKLSNRYPFEVVGQQPEEPSRVPVELYMADDKAKKVEKADDKEAE